MPEGEGHVGPHPSGPSVELPTRYRLQERIGSGRTATVWLARDTRTGTYVAVKELHLPTERGDALEGLTLERFEREVRSLGRLVDVPGVCRVFEVGVDRAGIPWFVAEHMSGGPLSSYGGRLSREDCRMLFGALAAAHERGIVHGDISPGNVLLDSSGSPVLADFGLARLGPASGNDVPGGMTPAYAAPERIRGAAATAPADVYALAASLRGYVMESDTLLSRVLGAAMDPDPTKRPSAVRVGRRLR